MRESDKENIPCLSQGRGAENQRFVGLIINTIVHSLNNTIGLIRGYADLSLRAAEPDGRVYPYLKHIIDGANSLEE